MPDTIVYDDVHEPVWIYNSKTGMVCQTSDFGNQHVANKFINRRFEFDIVAVRKEA